MIKNYLYSITAFCLIAIAHCTTHAMQNPQANNTHTALTTKDIPPLPTIAQPEWVNLIAHNPKQAFAQFHATPPQDPLGQHALAQMLINARGCDQDIPGGMYILGYLSNYFSPAAYDLSRLIMHSHFTGGSADDCLERIAYSAPMAGFDLNSNRIVNDYPERSLNLLGWIEEYKKNNPAKALDFHCQAANRGYEPSLFSLPHLAQRLKQPLPQHLIAQLRAKLSPEDQQNYADILGIAPQPVAHAQESAIAPAQPNTVAQENTPAQPALQSNTPENTPLQSAILTTPETALQKPVIAQSVIQPETAIHTNAGTVAAQETASTPAEPNVVTQEKTPAQDALQSNASENALQTPALQPEPAQTTALKKSDSSTQSRHESVSYADSLRSSHQSTSSSNNSSNGTSEDSSNDSGGNWVESSDSETLSPTKKRTHNAQATSPKKNSSTTTSVDDTIARLTRILNKKTVDIGALQDATVLLNQLEQEPFKTYPVRTVLAKAYFRLGDYKQARAHLTQLPKKDKERNALLALIEKEERIQATHSKKGAQQLWPTEEKQQPERLGVQSQKPAEQSPQPAVQSTQSAVVETAQSPQPAMQHAQPAAQPAMQSGQSAQPAKTAARVQSTNPAERLRTILHQQEINLQELNDAVNATSATVVTKELLAFLERTNDLKQIETIGSAIESCVTLPKSISYDAAKILMQKTDPNLVLAGLNFIRSAEEDVTPDSKNSDLFVTSGALESLRALCKTNKSHLAIGTLGSILIKRSKHESTAISELGAHADRMEGIALVTRAAQLNPQLWSKHAGRAYFNLIPPEHCATVQFDATDLENLNKSAGYGFAPAKEGLIILILQAQQITAEDLKKCRRLIDGLLKENHTSEFFASILDRFGTIYTKFSTEVKADIPADPVVGLKYLRAAADQGHAGSCIKVATMLMYGIGSKQELETAITYLDKAEMLDPKEKEMGIIPRGIIHMYQGDYARARTILTSAMDCNLAGAFWYLAMTMHYQNEDFATTIYPVIEKGAESKILLNEKIVKDLRKSGLIDRLQKEADSGNANACYFIGIINQNPTWGNQQLMEKYLTKATDLNNKATGTNYLDSRQELAAHFTNLFTKTKDPKYAAAALDHASEIMVYKISYDPKKDNAAETLKQQIFLEQAKKIASACIDRLIKLDYRDAATFVEFMKHTTAVKMLEGRSRAGLPLFVDNIKR